jgi:hypothetical protein
MIGLEKLRDSSFMENLWGNFLLAIIISSLIFLIFMAIVQLNINYVN